MKKTDIFDIYVDYICSNYYDPEKSTKTHSGGARYLVNDTPKNTIMFNIKTRELVRFDLVAKTRSTIKFGSPYYKKLLRTVLKKSKLG